MILQTRSRIILGAVVAVALIAGAVARNPFVEVCASRAWGVPFPIYVSWCECFKCGETLYPRNIAANAVIGVAGFFLLDFIVRNWLAAGEVRQDG